MRERPPSVVGESSKMPGGTEPRPRGEGDTRENPHRKLALILRHESWFTAVSAPLQSPRWHGMSSPSAKRSALSATAALRIVPAIAHRWQPGSLAFGVCCAREALPVAPGRESASGGQGVEGTSAAGHHQAGYRAVRRHAGNRLRNCCSTYCPASRGSQARSTGSSGCVSRRNARSLSLAARLAAKSERRMAMP